MKLIPALICVGAILTGGCGTQTPSAPYDRATAAAADVSGLSRFTFNHQFPLKAGRRDWIRLKGVWQEWVYGGVILDAI
ncbi:MAG: hypothetical protein IT581_05025 [Verrucomicrobiales bacterium]|nr:hypothetical protein [Verrucomicrobiales bacterium]